MIQYIIHFTCRNKKCFKENDEIWMLTLGWWWKAAVVQYLFLYNVIQLILTYSLTSFDLTALYDEYAG